MIEENKRAEMILVKKLQKDDKISWYEIVYEVRCFFKIYFQH